MPRRRGTGLSLAEWLVLCLVSQEPSHGFALAAVLAPDGEVGMVWHVRKAVIYRAAQRLERLGLITAEDRQNSRLGPPRDPLSATAEGHEAAQGWLSQSAAHPRDVRCELLLTTSQGRSQLGQQCGVQSSHGEALWNIVTLASNSHAASSRARGVLHGIAR